MTKNSQVARPTGSAVSPAREARIQELILAVGLGWYHVPDEPLAEAILKRTGTTLFLRPAPRTPAEP